MKISTKALCSIYLAAGFFLGAFVGQKLFPSLWSSSEEGARDRAAIQKDLSTLQKDLVETLLLSEHIVAAKVQINGKKASATVTFAEGVAGPDQVDTITHQVASGAGLQPGAVAIYDSRGEHLNLRANQEHEVETFWTNLAINVAKIVAIIVALIVVRWIIRSLFERPGDPEGATT